ncbi:MAG: hypothetical protein K2H01_00460 [Ruminococcus sp.]|nr:hypothetical protein [Ruminococcus sp.]
MKLDLQTANLICDLEYLIGRKCFNPKSYNGWANVEGLLYRYPVTFQRIKDGDKIKADHKVQYAVAEEITPEMVESLRYKIGVNELYIRKGLIDILNEIERRYGLDFNSLEKEYQSKL